MIGNYVTNRKYTLEIIEVLQNNFVRVKTLGLLPDESDEYTFAQHLPIPITDSELTKLGASFDGASWNIGTFRFLKLANALVWNPCDGVVVPLQYTHQLQNLYFALTQTEIKYK